MNLDSKHVYLILAHSDPLHFKKLIKALDDLRNDIYVHIDLKADITKFNNIKTQFSNLYFLEDRVNVYWGTVSQIEAEYKLWESILNKDYKRIHLISGSDFPIKSQNYIHNFFDKYSSFEFINYEISESVEKEILKKCMLRHYFLKKSISSSIVSNFRRSILLFQLIFGIRKSFSFKKLYKGSNWVSVTQDFANKLIEYKQIIFSEFKRAHCCDEIYKQSIAKKEGYLIFPEGNLRHIDFRRGNGKNPYTFKLEDYNELIKSEAMFARKFSSIESQELTNRILSEIK